MTYFILFWVTNLHKNFGPGHKWYVKKHRDILFI